MRQLPAAGVSIIFIRSTRPTGIITHNKGLQRGLNPESKAVRVAGYYKNMIHEVEVLAHSCGVKRPRLLRRMHVRIVQDNGKSIAMDELYPCPEALPDYRAEGAAELAKASAAQ